jgi:hypothetical protein
VSGLGGAGPPRRAHTCDIFQGWGFKVEALTPPNPPPNRSTYLCVRNDVDFKVLSELFDGAADMQSRANGVWPGTGQTKSTSLPTLKARRRGFGGWGTGARAAAPRPV